MQKLRELIERTSGYYIHKKGNLPTGCKFEEDVQSKLQLEISTIFDVGANIGQSVHYFKKHWPGAAIHAFEPVTYSFDILNKVDYPDLFCNKCGLADFQGTKEINLFEEGRSILNSLKDELKSYASDKVEVVGVDTLDNYVLTHNIDSIDVVKIDTEGYELEVLKGSIEALRANRIKMVLAEVGFSKSNVRHTFLPDIVSFLEEYDLLFFHMYGISHRTMRKRKHYGNALFVNVNHIK